MYEGKNNLSYYKPTFLEKSLGGVATHSANMQSVITQKGKLFPIDNPNQ